MSEYNKTDNLGLNIIERDNIVQIEPITDNFKEIDKAVGDVKGLSIQGFSGTKTIANVVKFIFDKIKNLKLVDSAVDVEAEGKKLNTVIGELKEKDRTQDVDINNKVSESTYNAGVSDINSKISANTNKIDDVKRHVGDVLGTTMYGMGKNNSTAYILDQLDRRIGNLPSLKAYGKSNTSVLEFIKAADGVDNTQNQAIETLKNQTKAISDELDGSNARFSELNNELEGYVDRLKRLRG